MALLVQMNRELKLEVQHLSSQCLDKDQEIADLQRQLREAQAELSAWHQEFTTTVNGKPYVLDALEAGKMVQDAEAEARMAKQDAAEQRALAIEARNVIGQVAAAYHRLVCGGSPAYWECIYPICQEARRTYLKLTPAEAHRSPQGGQEGD